MPDGMEEPIVDTSILVCKILAQETANENKNANKTKDDIDNIQYPVIAFLDHVGKEFTSANSKVKKEMPKLMEQKYTCNYGICNNNGGTIESCNVRNDERNNQQCNIKCRSNVGRLNVQYMDHDHKNRVERKCKVQHLRKGLVLNHARF
jgi:hypothetical protein